jgi:hypothetical protein
VPGERTFLSTDAVSGKNDFMAFLVAGRSTLLDKMTRNVDMQE